MFNLSGRPTNIQCFFLARGDLNCGGLSQAALLLLPAASTHQYAVLFLPLRRVRRLQAAPAAVLYVETLQYIGLFLCLRRFVRRLKMATLQYPELLPAEVGETTSS